MNELLVTCEHGGNRVPAGYRALFGSDARRRLLQSHRGWDPGALRMARRFARRFGAPLIAAEVTRLLVELNRSPGHPALFSEVSQGLDEAARREVIARYYLPYREHVKEAIAALLREERGDAPRGARRTERPHAGGLSRAVLHLSVHTFTPVLHGVRRKADVGILYDPRREREKRFALAWARAIRREAPHLRVRRNYPYRGAADGLTTTMRRRFPASRYLGIELEVNQRFFLESGAGNRAGASPAAREEVVKALEISLERAASTL
jgi:predicted N-formylglutamate amidohydrolase